ISLRTLCLDAKDGKEQWSTEVFSHDAAKAPRIHRKNSHASPTPITDGKRLFVHFGHLGTACLDLKGKVLWQNSEVRYSPVHGNGGSPILVDDLLFFSCDGASDPFVVAVDQATGKVRWRKPRQANAVKKFSFSTPLLIEVKGHKQIISPGSDIVVAYEAK